MAKILNLKRLLDHIQKVCLRKSAGYPLLSVDEQYLEVLRIAEKYEMSLYLERQEIHLCQLEGFRLFKDPKYKALNREQTWVAGKLQKIWKSNLSRKRKIRLFVSTVERVLPLQM